MRSKAQFWRIVIGLALFGIAFGYVEAAVVVYLRALYTPLRAHFYPAASVTDLFPLLSIDQLRASGPEHISRLNTELGREFATLLMLAGVALTAARKPREWVAAFALCFGIWDLAFYAFLKLLLNWPASLLTWDILFLLPVPWAGPVIAPILVAVSMSGAGLVVLWREHADRPVHVGRAPWVCIALGALTIFIAFIYDFPNTARGGVPNAFRWDIFFGGEALALVAFAVAVRATKKRGRVNRLISD